MSGHETLTRKLLKKDNIVKMKDDEYQQILDGDKVKWFEKKRNVNVSRIYADSERNTNINKVDEKRIHKKDRLDDKKTAKAAKASLLEKRKGKDGLPISPEEQLELEKIMRGKWAKENWMTEKHGGFTNLELIKQINEGNHSNFEKMEGVMRDLAATKLMESYKGGKYKTLDTLACTEEDISELVDELEQDNMFFNPVFRLGLSQYARVTEEDKRVSNLRRIDNEIAKRIMIRTLTFKMEEKHEKRYKESITVIKEENKDAYLEYQKKMELAKRSQMAKQLMLMHMGKIKIVDDDGNGKEPTVPLASILAHCSRTMIITPNFTDDDHHGNEDEMWDSILKHKGKNPGYTNAANIKKRGSSTHSLENRKKDAKYGVETKKKLNLVGQTGMDVAIGGMGSDGVDGKMIDQNGTCGHVYGMHKRSDAGVNGAYLFGYESDSYGHTNQLGHTHDLKATGEKASSFLCHRIDEIGAKYGGRQADVSHYNSTWIAKCMNAIDAVFDSGNEQLIKKVSEKLCGNLMNDNEFSEFLNSELKIGDVMKVKIMDARGAV